jgi:hypothetical protein
MARARRAAGGAAPAALLLLLCAAAAAPRRAGAQSQGAALEKLREALGPTGWEGIDPTKDACEYPGYVTPGVICDGSTITDL